MRQYEFLGGTYALLNLPVWNQRKVYSASTTPGGRQSACPVVDPATGLVWLYGKFLLMT